jgi:hypothetical protein
VAATIPKTREGQVEMIRVLRVARRGALKARVAAAEQLHGVLSSAPEELRQPLLGLKTKALVRLCAAMRPGPLTSPTAATKTTLRTLARRWQQLQAELDQLDGQLQTLVATAAPTLLALPGVGVDTAPASCWSPPATTPNGSAPRLPSRTSVAPLRSRRPRAAPTATGSTGAATAGPTMPLAHCPGPHALPPRDQGLCRAADQTRPVQARHPALFEALHRPRGLPIPHKPTTHRRYCLPEIGGITTLTSTVRRELPSYLNRSALMVLCRRGK